MTSSPESLMGIWPKSVFTMLGTKTPDPQSYLSTQTKIISREVKDLVILPLLQKTCKDKIKVLLC